MFIDKFDIVKITCKNTLSFGDANPCNIRVLIDVEKKKQDQSQTLHFNPHDKKQPSPPRKTNPNKT